MLQVHLARTPCTQAQRFEVALVLELAQAILMTLNHANHVFLGDHAVAEVCATTVRMVIVHTALSVAFNELNAGAFSVNPGKVRAEVPLVEQFGGLCVLFTAAGAVEQRVVHHVHLAQRLPLGGLDDAGGASVEGDCALWLRSLRDEVIAIHLDGLEQG